MIKNKLQNNKKITETKMFVVMSRMLNFVITFTLVFSFAFSNIGNAATSQFTTSLSTTGVSSDPPTVPADLTATPVAYDQIDLSWSASVSGGLYGIAGYRIFKDSIFLATTTLLVYSDTGLTASTTYSYTVEAFDTAMQMSGQSAAEATTTLQAPVIPPVATTTPPTTGGGSTSGSTLLLIQNVKILPDLHRALVTFHTTVPAQTKVYWGTTQDFETGSLSSFFYGYDHELLLTGLNPGKVYNLRIEATNSQGFTVREDMRFSTNPSFVAPLANPQEFKAIPETNSIALDWKNPIDSRFDGVRIVRSETFFPRDQFDGTPIYEGNGQNAIDNNVEIGKTYYYAIFAKNKNGEFSSGALAKAKIIKEGEIVIKATSTDPFADIPESENVDPMIKKIDLSYFEFLQEGKILAVVNGTVAIDGGQALTIRLKYDKVPEILKTIAFTLQDPDDKDKNFPFLLRINSEKTYYEATIGALGKSGKYGMSVVILDYENKGLKRLHGTLVAAVFASGITFGKQGIDPIGLFFLLLLLILLLLIARAILKGGRRYEEALVVNRDAPKPTRVFQPDPRSIKEEEPPVVMSFVKVKESDEAKFREKEDVSTFIK